MKLTPINPHFNACDQKWELMPEQEHGGRLCETCERVLVDFTQLSEQQVLNQQRDNNFKLCGRYTRGQVDRLHRHLAMEESQYKRPWLVSLAIGVGSLLPLGVAAQVDTNAPDSTAPEAPVRSIHMKGLAEEVVNIEVLQPTDKKRHRNETKQDIAPDSITIPIKQSVPLPGVPGALTYPILDVVRSNYIIEGTVTDKETGEPIAYASIYNPYLKIGTVADDDGKFRIEAPHDSAVITIAAGFIGYEVKEMQVFLGKETLNLDIQLESSVMGLMVGAVIYTKPSLKQRVANSINPAHWYRRIKHLIKYR